MEFESKNHDAFAYEMMETMVSATEIFNTLLLNNLKKFFSIRNAFITVFDFDGHFLSLTDLNRIYLGNEHPYALMADKDICAKKIIDECRRDKMWHDNLKPYLYRSTDLLAMNDAETSDYVRFLNERMHAKYLLIMPFDINGCIHVCIYRGEGESDFSDTEMAHFEKIYMYIARTFKSFKALEKPRIISDIKDEVILTKNDAYVIADINHKVLTCNGRALEYMAKASGRIKNAEDMRDDPLIGFVLQGASDTEVTKTTINGYVFNVHPFPMNYIHGMVETYHWITIHKAETSHSSSLIEPVALTKREKKVAELLAKGKSYQEIADELFISFHTVKNHVQNIFSKYNVNTRYQFYEKYK